MEQALVGQQGLFESLGLPAGSRPLAPPPARRHRPSPANWQERFDAFHAKKPEVYRKLVELAREVRGQWPDRRIGIELLMNRVRWDFNFNMENSGEDFKINQNFAAYYARMMMVRERDLKGMFELRAIGSDRKKAER